MRDIFSEIFGIVPGLSHRHQLKGIKLWSDFHGLISISFFKICLRLKAADTNENTLGKRILEGRTKSYIFSSRTPHRRSNAQLFCLSPYQDPAPRQQASLRKFGCRKNIDQVPLPPQPLKVLPYSDPQTWPSQGLNSARAYSYRLCPRRLYLCHLPRSVGALPGEARHGELRCLATSRFPVGDPGLNLGEHRTLSVWDSVDRPSSFLFSNLAPSSPCQCTRPTVSCS